MHGFLGFKSNFLFETDDTSSEKKGASEIGDNGSDSGNNTEVALAQILTGLTKELKNQ